MAESSYKESLTQQIQDAYASGMSSSDVIRSVYNNNSPTAAAPVGSTSKEELTKQIQDAYDSGYSAKDITSSYFNGKSYVQRANQPEEKPANPSGWERAGRTVLGAAEQYAGSLLGTAASYYEGGTRGSQAEYERLGELAKEQVREAHESYRSALEKAQYNMDDKDVQRAKRILDSAINEQRMYQTATTDNVKAGLAETADTFYGAANKVSEAGAKNIERAKQGAGRLGSLAIDVGVGGLQMGADIGLAALTGGTNILPIMAARTYGGGALEARNAGASYERQVAYGGAVALTEILTEKLSDIPGLAGGGLLDNTVNRTIRSMANKPAGMTAFRLMLAFKDEAIEEILSDAVNPLARSIYNGKSIKENYSEEKISDWLYSGLVGGILGLGGTVSTQVMRGTISLENSKARIANDAESRLTQRGFDKKTAGNLAELVSQQLSGEELSTEQKAELAKWPTAQEVLSEMQKEGVAPTDKRADKRPGNILAKHKAARADEKVIARAATANLNALEQHELGAIYEAAYRQGNTALCERVLEEQARRVNEVFSKMSRGEVLDLTADQKALYEKIRRQLRNPTGKEQGRPDLYDENTPPASDTREQQQAPMYTDEEAPPARAVPDYMREESVPPAPAQQAPLPAQEQRPAQQPVPTQQNSQSKTYNIDGKIYTVDDASANAAIARLDPNSEEFKKAVRFYSKEGIEESAGNIQVREDEAKRNELLEAVKKQIEQKKSAQSGQSAPSTTNIENDTIVEESDYDSDENERLIEEGNDVYNRLVNFLENGPEDEAFQKAGDRILDPLTSKLLSFENNRYKPEQLRQLMEQAEAFMESYANGRSAGTSIEEANQKYRDVIESIVRDVYARTGNTRNTLWLNGRPIAHLMTDNAGVGIRVEHNLPGSLNYGHLSGDHNYLIFYDPQADSEKARTPRLIDRYYNSEFEHFFIDALDQGAYVATPQENAERMKGADNGGEQAVQQPEQPAQRGEGAPSDAAVEGRGEERLGNAVRGEPGQPVYSTADSGGAGSASDAGEVGSSAGSQGDQRSQREGARDEAAEQVTWAKRQETASVLSDKGESRRIVGEGQDALDSPDGRIVKVSENCEEIVSPRKGSIAHFIKYMFKVFGASGRNGHIYTARFNITDANGNPTGINASGVNCGDEVAVAINERANALKRKEELETAGHEVSHKRMSDMFGSGKARASIDSSGNVVVERRAEKAYSITMDALTRFYGSRQSAEVMYNAIANYYLRASSTNYLNVYNNDGSVWAYQTTTWITEAQVEEALRKHVIEEFLVECCGHGNKIRKMANDGIINYSDIDRLETAVMDAMRRSKVLTWSQERVLREMRRLTSEDKISRSFSDFITGKFERVGRKSTRISNRDTGTEFRLAESLNAILDKLNADNSPDKNETSDLGDFTDYELRAVLEYCMEGIPAGGKTTVERIANQLLGVNSTNDIVNTDLVVAGDKKMQTRLRVLRAVLEELDLRGEDISKESSLWRFHRFSTSESELSPESDPEDIVAAIQDGDENLEKDIMFGNGEWSSLDVNERLAILNESPDQSYYDAGNDRIGKEGMFGLEDPEYSKDPMVRSEMDIEQRQSEFDDTLDNDSEQKYDEEKKASDLDALIKTTEYERKRAAGEPVSWSEDAEEGSNFAKGTIPVPKEWNGWVKQADISEEEYEEARQILEDSKRSNELNSTLHKLQARLAELQRFSNALAGNLITESDNLKSKVRNYRLAAQDYMELVDTILSENPDNSLAARYYGNATVLNTLASQLEYQLLSMRSEYMNNKGAKMVSGNIKAVLDAIEIVSNELTSKSNPMSPEVLEEYGFDQKAVEGRRRRENWAKRTVHQHDEMGQYLRDSDGNYIVPDAENSARGYSQEMTELEEPTRNNSEGVPPPVKYESRNTAKTHARAKSSEAAKADSALSNRYSGGQDTDFLEARNRRVEAARKEEQARLDAAFNEKLKNRKPRNKDAYKGFDFAREMSRNGTSSGYEQEDISSGYGIDKGFSNSTFGKKNVFASGYSEDSGVSLSTSGNSGTTLEKMCANIIDGKGALFESSTDADQAPAHDDTDDPRHKLTKEEKKEQRSRVGEKSSTKPVTPEVSQAMLHLQEDVTGILKSDAPIRHVLSLAESLTSYQPKDSEMNWITSKEINDTVREIQDAYKMAEEDVDAKAQRMANATAKLLALVSAKVERAEINRADEFAFEEAAEKNGKEATNVFGKARYFHDSWRFNPTTQFKMIDGFDKGSNGIGYRRAKQIENSVAKEQIMTGDVFTRYAALQNEKGIQEFAEGKSMCEVPVPGVGTITEQQAVELVKSIRTLAYQEIGDKHRHRLDTIAGFTFVDKNGKEISVKRADLKSSKESSFYEDMRHLEHDILEKLSPAAKKYIEITDGILFDVGNEVSKVKQQVTGVGFDKFEKGYYYPVRYRSPAHQTDYTDSYERGGLFDPFTDRTKTTGGYVYIGSAADTVDNYIRNAIYAASYANLSDTLDFMNSTALGMRGMANVVGDNYGKSFARAFNNYTNDVAQRFDKDSSGFNQMMGKARSLLQQGALRFSVSVPIKQTASYWDAMGMLSPEALREAYRFKATKAKGYGKGHPILDVRGVGGIDPTLSEILNNKGYLSELKKKSKIADAWDKAISVMDYRTVDDLYHACIIDTKLSYSDLDVNSKMFKDIVSMKFREVVLNTQPVFNANARSQAARTKNELVRMVSMFQTQQTQNYNRLVTAIGEAKAAGTQLDPIAKRTLRRTVAGQVAAVAEFSLLQMLADLALHRKKQYKEDDDDKADAGKIIGRFLMNAVESAAGTVWLGDQAAKLAIDFVTGDSSNTSGEFRGLSLGPVSSAMSAVDNVVSAADSIRDAIVNRDPSKLNASSIRYGITNTAQLFGIPANNVASAINSIAMYGLDAAYTLSGGKAGNRLGEDKFIKIVNSWIKGEMTVDGAKRQVNKALKREQPENVLYNVGILEAEGAARAKKNGTDDPHSGRDYLSSRLKKIGADGDTPNERIVNYLISSKLSDTEIDKAVDSYVTAYSYNALYDAARKTGMSPKAVVKALDEIDANDNGDIAKSELKNYYKQHGDKSNKLVEALWGAKDYKTIIPDDGEYEKFTVHYDAVMNTGVSAARASSIVDACKNDQGSITQGAIYQYYLAHSDDEEQIKALFESMGYKQNGKAKTWDWFKKNYKPK